MSAKCMVNVPVHSTDSAVEAFELPTEGNSTQRIARFASMTECAIEPHAALTLDSPDIDIRSGVAAAGTVRRIIRGIQHVGCGEAGAQR